MVGLSLVSRGRWFAGALLLAACGSDVAGAGDEDLTGGSATSGADSTEPNPEVTGSEGDSQDSDTDTSDPAGTGTAPGSDESTGEVGEPCLLDCGPNGWCELDEEQRPVCGCDDGFASTGLACVACTTVEGQIDADVPIVDAVIELRVNDATPPAMVGESAKVFLRNTTSGDEVLLGSTLDGTVTKTVVPGNYEVYYSKQQGGTAIPVNRNARLSTMYIDDAGPIVVDIPMATLSGRFTIAGEQPTESPYDYGRVLLVDPITGDEAVLGNTRDRSFLVNVIPGEYEIHYRLVQSDGQAPVNGDARLGTVVVLPPSEVLQELAIDVPAVDVQGAITVNGEPPPGLVGDYGRIVFEDTRTGDRLQVGVTLDGAYAARIVSGDYDVFYERVAGGTGVPVNQHALLTTTELVGGAFDIDIQAVPLTGSFTVAGEVPPTNASDDGVMMLRNATGDVAVLGNTHDVSFDAMVVPGTYDVYYAQETAGAVMPGNTNAYVRQLKVGNAAARTLDVPVAHVSGVLAVSGAVPPDSVYDDGRVYLRNQDTGDSVLLGNTRLAQYEAAIVPGTYDIVYEAELSDQVMPVNKAAVIVSNVEVAGDMLLDIDVPVAQVAGVIQIADATPPTGGEELGNLYLEDVASADLIWLGSTLAPNFARPLAAGRYLLRYRGQSAGEALPANNNAGISCFDVKAE